MSICVIHNAGSGSADSAATALRCARGAEGTEICPTGRAGDAARFAREAVARGCRRVIAMGGDGTVHEVVNGLAPEFAAELAVVPTGTGNDLGRCLGLPLDDPAAAMELALAAPAVPIDLVRIGGDRAGFFINASIGGFGGEIGAELESTSKQRWGPIAYWAAAASHLGELPDHALQLELDSRPLEVHVLGLAIANGRSVAGGFPVAPDALLDDGLIDLTLVTAQPLLETLLAGLDMILGRQDRSDRVVTLRARHAVIRAQPKLFFNVDGEPLGHVDLEFEVMPSALRVVMGTPACVGGSRDQLSELQSDPS